MIEVKNAAEFNDQLDAWEAALVDATWRVTQGIARDLLITLVNHSAQFSGDFAANWNYSVGSPNYTFVDNVFNGKYLDVSVGAYGRPNSVTSKLIEGHQAALQYALAKINLGNFELGETIYITNAAAHDEPYADKIEAGTIKFRSGNLGAPVARSMAIISTKYSTISSSQLSFLARKV